MKRNGWRTGSCRGLLVLAALAGAAGCGGATVPAHGQLSQDVRVRYQPRTRTQFIAADEVDWDYAPSGINKITGQPFDDEANVFVQQGPDRIGRVYRKALYREYTDATFSALKPVDPRWQHLGALGPVVRGVVGDKIVVVFRNNTTLPASVHPHGVFYLKDSEGAGYDDGTAGGDKSDDAVPPGGEHVYEWDVPERAGPGPMDGSSVVWMYHSHVNEPQDENSGLMGPMIVTSADHARDDGSPDDTDRELVALFKVYDENDSHYLDSNIQRFAGRPASVDPENEDFQESNLMHAINGYVYGNLPGLDMVQGERVRWYLVGMGTEVDLHTPHWHGQTALVGGMRTDVASLLPMEMVTADMVPDNPGPWLFHCHVNDHIKAGMLALFNVATR